MVLGGLCLSRYKTDRDSMIPFREQIKENAMLKNNKWKGAIYTTSKSAPELDRIYIKDLNFESA